MFTSTVLQPLQRSTWVSRHLQIRTAFCYSKVLLPMCSCRWQLSVTSGLRRRRQSSPQWCICTGSTTIILITYNSSFFSICLTMSLESTAYFSPSTSFQSLCLWLACSCSYHFFSLCQLTTLTTHNSLSLSLPAQDLPLPQIFPTIDSLPASGLTPRTWWPDRFFWEPRFVVFSFLHYSFFYSVQQSTLATCQLSCTQKCSLSYHIILANSTTTTTSV